MTANGHASFFGRKLRAQADTADSRRMTRDELPETDRHWEQDEDPSMLDPNIQTYGPSGKFAVADSSERKEAIGS
jgi:hypothetical protein